MTIAIQSNLISLHILSLHILSLPPTILCLLSQTSISVLIWILKSKEKKFYFSYKLHQSIRNCTILIDPGLVIDRKKKCGVYSQILRCILKTLYRLYPLMRIVSYRKAVLYIFCVFKFATVFEGFL